jgi:hypothetical protein
MDKIIPKKLYKNILVIACNNIYDMKYNTKIVHGNFYHFRRAERDKSAHGVTINFFSPLRAHFYMHNLHRNDILLNFQNLIKFIVCKFFK